MYFPEQTMPRHIAMRDVPCRPAGDPEHQAIPKRNLGPEFAGMLQTPNPMDNSDSAINGPVASPMPSASPIQALSGPDRA